MRSTPAGRAHRNGPDRCTMKKTAHRLVATAVALAATAVLFTACSERPAPGSGGSGPDRTDTQVVDQGDPAGGATSDSVVRNHFRPRR